MAAVTGFIDFTVTGISCTPPSGAQRAECCANRIGATASSFAYSFCMAICVLCCMVCEISFKYNFDESAPGGVEDPEPNAEHQTNLHHQRLHEPPRRRADCWR